MAIIKRRRRRRRQRAAFILRPRTASQYSAKPSEFQERWNAVTHAVTAMRTEGRSLTSAARELGIDPRTVARLGAPALRKRPSGRYAAKASDSLLRVLLVPTQGGLAEIAIRGSREATRLAEYWNAVQWFLDTGDSLKLQAFRGKSVTDADGERLPLLTDPDELERLGNVGELSFESIYAKAT